MFYRICLTLFIFTSSLIQAAVPEVVVTIKPVHALVAGVMKGVAMPKLLLSTHEDAHHFSLTPSLAKTLIQAQLMVWVGPEMEIVLEKPIRTLVKGKVVRLIDLPGLTKYDLAPGHVDPHIWLDPDNAKIIVRSVAQQLAGLDPDHAGVYQENAQTVETEINEMTAKLRKELEPVKNRTYFVFHDAYQYFEKAFGLARSIPVVQDAEGSLRAGQREKLEVLARENNVTCLFGEPFHGEEVAKNLAEQMGLNLSFLDPMGQDNPSSPQASYIDMMTDLAATIKQCLTAGKS